MIVVTGAAGFIGSCLLSSLLHKNKIVAVDDFGRADKNKNLQGLNVHKIDRKLFFGWLEQNHQEVNFIYHLGARTDTTEFDYNIFEELNISYSKKMWQACSKYQIPLVYASSAATYGLGELGYEDNENNINKLKPLNPYGESKNEFDKWALLQDEKPPFWAGLKFFNVYGANEYHKGRMASVVFHAFHQIRESQAMKLFRSHHPDFRDGEQLRDFVYIKDVISVCEFLGNKNVPSGIYNLGTGQARTFLDLVRSVFGSMEIKENISFIDTPADIRNTYQYFTQANMTKLISAGYQKSFFSLEEGIRDYVKNYLIPHHYFYQNLFV